MASVIARLTLCEFEQRYEHEKPYYEFWHGEAIQKAVPTWLHGLLQGILIQLLREAGYKSGSEVKLKIDKEFQLVPDVIATRGKLEFPYPTKAVEVVVEILSEEDPIPRVLTKCRTYQTWGFAEIYVVDPKNRLVFRWIENRLEESSEFASLPAERIWAELDNALA